MWKVAVLPDNAQNKGIRIMIALVHQLAAPRALYSLPVGQASAWLENHMGHTWGRIVTTSVEAEKSNAVTVRTHAKHRMAAKSCLNIKDAVKIPIAKKAYIATGDGAYSESFVKALALGGARTLIHKKPRSYARPAKLS